MTEPEAVDFEAAFEDLFRQAYHVAFRIVGHSGEAEDAAAETLARAAHRWRRVGRSPSPTAWVIRVATNLSVDIVRRRRFTTDAPFDVGVGPRDSDTAIALRELLRALPRRQRDVLALRYLVDLPEAEIAAVLGISPGSVKRHASRGISRLRTQLHDPEGGISLAW